MIAAFMIHALGVGALCAAAAWAAERALAQLGRPRRLAWAIGMVASVVIALPGSRPEAATVTAAATTATVAASGAHTAIPVLTATFMRLPPVPTNASLELLLAVAWMTLSATALVAYLLTARRLARRARGWTMLSPAGDDVLLADDIGPAVFGLWRSRVVLPRWLSAASLATQKLVLAHERQHVAARDPQLLAAGLALVMMFPWNLPLLWQLRRLRFALEVDCDARVLAGADAAEYGEALLVVSQRSGQAPAGAIALIERPSQLERRIEIMTTTAHRFRKALGLAALGLAALLLLAATSVHAPALAAVDLPLKPSPNGGTAQKLGQHFERMLADRFPALLEQNHEGTAMVVVLLNEDWSIARAVQVTGRDQVPVDERTFGVLGLAREDVPYVGNMGMQSPTNPKQAVLIVYTERKTPGQRFVSHVFPDNRAVDREIFRHYFPDAAQRGVPAGQGLWVLLDRQGHVLRSGQEPVDASAWNRTLEARYLGIQTQGITVTPVTDDAGEPVLDLGGKEVHLNSVWLAPGSPLPRG
ncbi:MAG TPA: M56 family metallopeptidase [Steroidobacteraceae bacterium]|nr:M56 family metallopeptidase [Steroidobacteraceae bacterium]